MVVNKIYNQMQQKGKQSGDVIGQQLSNLQLNSSLIYLPKKRQINEIEALKNQNNQLRLKNQAFREELQRISQKLDIELVRKIKDNESRRIQKVKAMELNNAYRMCQIYKRQVKSLRKREDETNISKEDDYHFLLKESQKENEKLRDEIKILKKISKIQEKGLLDNGLENYMKITLQNDKLRVESKNLKLKIDHLERIISRNKSGHRRTIGQSSMDEHSPVNYHKNIQLYKSVQERDSQKIKHLNFQKNRLIELADHLKNQLQEKDKEIEALKKRIILKNKLKISKTKHITHTKTQNPQTPEKQRSKNSESEAENESLNKKKKPITLKESKDIKEVKELKIVKEIKEIKEEGAKVEKKRKLVIYPRNQQFGVGREGSTKWNHSNFLSRIKEIQVMPHPKGHIQNLHVRYQKGEPLKMAGQYSSFLCQQNEEFIESLKGGFKDGLLQYLQIGTNFKRVNKFCRYDLQNECSNFVFDIQQNQYPAATFGEYTSQGIVKLGCIIDKQL